MKITFMQSGGFAGMSRGVELDTAALPRGEADELAGLLKAARDSGAGCPAPAAGPRGADSTSYVIKLEGEKTSGVEFKWSDLTMTDEQAALVQWLSSRSKPRRL